MDGEGLQRLPLLWRRVGARERCADRSRMQAGFTLSQFIYYFQPGPQGYTGSSADGQRGERWLWNRTAVEHHKFLMFKEQTFVSFRFLVPSCFCVEEQSNESFLPEWCVAAAECLCGVCSAHLSAQHYKYTSQVRQLLAAFLPQNLLAWFNRGGGKRNFYPDAPAFARLNKGNIQNLTKAIVLS